MTHNMTQAIPAPAMVQQMFSQEEVKALVEKARQEGEGSGYQRGYAEAENHYNPPPPPPKCPECGSEARVEHEPFEQEYAGASYTPAQDWGHCENPDCEHCWKIASYSCEGQVTENRRGW